ncbi:MULTISPECIES: tetratricopeptide repeat protein [unclassified Tenacibaculum]|uniref:tetratricopeptide repeat protein n=1 Tax=unclassified Tenacibaculum TaxID=2635139 RepID=UPI001F197700|nr:MULTISPECIES: tetratricopeptide repeat protein [unclassified Tenacibaculum]MCF2875226.1 tetratricopeptide repeat protein [Tenacibaculum sp. Cn5-1]MCF2935302.1 tetratricopeptide repeat protein [Tenacibaculum sp. Cn5-34]MCG7511256.1 tetratricopeptide repeat protein [Tenacibaculum sp. Cn5-46]
MRYLVTVFFALIITKSFSQEEVLNAVQLHEKVRNAINDQEKIKLLLLLAENQYENDLNFSEKRVEEAIELIGNKEDSISKQQLGKAYVLKGIVKRREANHPEAIEYYLKAKKIYQEQQDFKKVSDVYHNMGMVFRHQKEHDKAISFYKKSIKGKEVVNDYHGMAASYNMMGVSYRQSKRLDSALICYQKAKELFSKVGSVKNIQRVYNNMAILYHSRKEYDRAIALVNENIAFTKKNNKIYSLCTAYRNASNIYKKTKEYEKSLAYIDSSIQIAKREKFKDLIAKGYLRKSFLSAKLSNYKNAYEDYKKFNRYSDSLFNIENIKKIQALELNYQFKQEKQEIELLAESEKAKNNLYTIILLIIVLSSIFIGFLLNKNYRNKTVILKNEVEKEKEQKEELNKKIKINEEEIKGLIADNTMRLEFKQELLSRLKEDVLSGEVKEIKQKINTLTSELQAQLQTENKLSEVQTKISEVNKGFDLKLRELYPTLTKTEREICSLLRLNLSIKEIMIVRNASLDSVKSARYRIRKKLKLNSGEELEKFIQNLF